MTAKAQPTDIIVQFSRMFSIALVMGLNLETHVAQRIVDYRDSDQTPSWITTFWGTPAKSQAASVIQKIQNAISKEIIGSWNKIFHRPTSAKAVALEFNIDTSNRTFPM